MAVSAEAQEHGDIRKDDCDEQRYSQRELCEHSHEQSASVHSQRQLQRLELQCRSHVLKIHDISNDDNDGQQAQQ